MSKDIKIVDIEKYLSIKNVSLNVVIIDEIEKIRQNAILNQNEEEANYCWCLQQIFKIQKGFVSVINDLKNCKYEDAWLTLDNIDIALGYLEENFDLTLENDKYHMVFIGRMIKEYQKLFPYCYFFSRECVIKAEVCSICGQPISLRHPCEHKVGKLYMGELCLRKVVDMEFKAFCIVTDPFDRYTYVQLPNQEYNYGMLEMLMQEIESPFDEFYIETLKVTKPEYKNIGRNAPCPCGSGKKYKRCHLGTKDELMDHHKIHFLKHVLKRKNRFAGYFNTWK